MNDEIKKIAQWVIDNRYPKSENNKVSDAEMYHYLVEAMDKLCESKIIVCDCIIPKPTDPYHPIDKSVCRDCHGQIEESE